MGARAARFVLILAAGVLWIGSLAILSARSTPVVRTAAITLPGWPAKHPPVRVALIADIHFGNFAMPAARLRRIVDQVNAASPDLVVFAGDLLTGYDKVSAPDWTRTAVGELARLRAPLGTVAVLGNHDYGTAPDLIADALARANVTVLRNQAIERGGLVIGGLGDGYSGNARIAATVAAMRALRGVPIIVVHSPSDALGLPSSIPLVLAGHTHCGQVVPPIVGAIYTGSVARKFVCGVVREGSRTTIVTAGLGTTGLPVRLGAPPDLWLLTLEPGTVPRS